MYGVRSFQSLTPKERPSPAGVTFWGGACAFGALQLSWAVTRETAYIIRSVFEAQAARHLC